MTTNTTAPAEKLWCIHIPGPDDLCAAPDQQTAQKMADKHNAAMNKFLDAKPNRRSDFGVLGESAMADERAACALVCENLQPPESCTGVEKSLWDVATMACSEAILARYKE